MSIENTDEMVQVAQAATECRAESDDCIANALRAVLALPEVRQAIHDEVRRETEAKLRELGVTGYSVEYDR